MHFLPEHALEDLTLAHFFCCLITLALLLKWKNCHFLPPGCLRMNLSQYQDNPSLETGTTFSAGTLGRRSGKDNTRTTGGIAPKAILMVWGHVRSNGHYHYGGHLGIGLNGTCQSMTAPTRTVRNMPRLRETLNIERKIAEEEGLRFKQNIMSSQYKVHIWDHSDLCVDMFIMMRCVFVCLSRKTRKMITSLNCPNVSHEKWVLSQEGQLS